MALPDVVVDESRCVLARRLEALTVDGLLSELFRLAFSFEHCTLLLRHDAPLLPGPSRMLGALYNALHSLEPVLCVRVILVTRGDGDDQPVELAAIRALLLESMAHSSLRHFKVTLPC
jgi:hypothetical protein